MSFNSNANASPEEVAYFEHNPSPANLAHTVTQAQEFISHHTDPDHAPRRIALVTSGGTTVPLENQTVRFIDNFSAGTRGACSAEYLLNAGYAVIFLHRQYSLLPFARHYSHSTNCFLDFMDFALRDNATAGSLDPNRLDQAAAEADAKVVVREEWQSDMRKVLSRYKWAQRQNLLLLLPFITINEYLWSLRNVASLMKPLGSHALLYLAAAVSDFFVPAERMVEHKIQSNDQYRHGEKPGGDVDMAQPPAAHFSSSSLVIDLDPVPKFLKRLVDGWAPQGMIVSFKLETDPAILVEKARGALKKYSHHLVIGNLLSTRKWEVVFVYQEYGHGLQEKWIRVPPRMRQRSTSGLERLVGTADKSVSVQDDSGQSADGLGNGAIDGEPEVEIESLIIPKVAHLHDAFIGNGKNLQHP